jgi:hypothetical protein
VPYETDHDFDFEKIARDAWERQKTPLERMYDRWVGEGRWEPKPPVITFRIHDRVTGKAIPCHLCGSTEKWVVEGDEVRQLARVFVCEHEPILAIRAGIRQVSTVTIRKVGRIEETSRPPE